jgi:hypothetical protein
MEPFAGRRAVGRRIAQPAITLRYFELPISGDPSGADEAARAIEFRGETESGMWLAVYPPLCTVEGPGVREGISDSDTWFDVYLRDELGMAADLPAIGESLLVATIRAYERRNYDAVTLNWDAQLASKRERMVNCFRFAYWIPPGCLRISISVQIGGALVGSEFKVSIRPRCVDLPPVVDPCRCTVMLIEPTDSTTRCATSAPGQEKSGGRDASVHVLHLRLLTRDRSGKPTSLSDVAKSIHAFWSKDGATPALATSAPELGSPQPHQHQHWAAAEA